MTFEPVTQWSHDRFFGHLYRFNWEHLVFECACGVDWWPDCPVPEDMIGSRRGPTARDRFAAYT